ncbi:MAG: UvrD-helicase domain-containing protein [Rubrobacter sp.]|nr:UvrD-helicase domain-containing protein [Rubrobacter sp.]
MTTLSLFSLLEEQVAPEASGLTNEQRKAVERRDGPLFVHAGAGTGKTRVLVERFVRAVLEDEVGVERMLAITFTEKAAAELRTRIRARFVDAGERDHARAVDSAWISTIHGFCSRLLRANALSAGLDPEYRVLAEHEAERIAAHAFDSALEDFLGPPEDARRVELVAAHGPDRPGGPQKVPPRDPRAHRADPRCPRPPNRANGRGNFRQPRPPTQRPQRDDERHLKDCGDRVR